VELSYPLARSGRDQIRTASGLAVGEITLERVLAGGVAPADVRIAPDTLLRQATFAEQGGNPQLAENLRRGAELCAFTDEQLLAFYNQLRPGRSTAAQLEGLAGSLEARGANRCAALVRQASAAYLRRGLIT
jgi:propanediol dehydratase small subunit